MIKAAGQQLLTTKGSVSGGSIYLARHLSSTGQQQRQIINTLNLTTTFRKYSNNQATKLYNRVSYSNQSQTPNPTLSTSPIYNPKPTNHKNPKLKSLTLSPATTKKINMYAATSFVSPLLHDLLVDFHSRRLLLHSPLNQSPANPPSASSTNGHDSPTESSYLGDGNFDANVVMVLSVLLCALICSLGLNSIIRCALRCSNLVIINGDSAIPPARVANTGVKKKALKTFPTVSYSAELNLPSLDSECVICLSDFTNGERVRILPKCNHGFHVRCIDKWLSSHSSCPKCRQCLIGTCEKIVGCGQEQGNNHSATSSSQTPTPTPLVLPPVPETIVTIAPLEPEGLVRNYREVVS